MIYDICMGFMGLSVGETTQIPWLSAICWRQSSNPNFSKNKAIVGGFCEILIFLKITARRTCEIPIPNKWFDTRRAHLFGAFLVP